MGRAKNKKEEELGRGGGGQEDRGRLLERMSHPMRLQRKTLGEDVSSDEAAEEDSWRGMSHPMRLQRKTLGEECLIR